MVWREALEQNEIVFAKADRRGGLTVLAAPWRYAVVAKLQRIGSGNAQEFDAADVANFLRRYLHDRTTISASEIKAWSRYYSTPFADNSLDVVNIEAPGLLVME